MGFIPAERARDFMSTKLYVGNLPYETSESDLQTLFEGAGAVASVNLVRDRATGQARGFAFVEMNDDDGARRAITEFDKHEFGGRNVTLTRRGRWRLEVMAAAGSIVAVAARTVAVSRDNLAGKRGHLDPDFSIRRRRMDRRDHGRSATRAETYAHHRRWRCCRYRLSFQMVPHW